MRRANNANWITNENGELLGINLGADYCAEHEFGIRDLRHYFDLPSEETVFGIEKRTIRAVPEFLRFYQFKKRHDKKQKMHYLLVVERPWKEKSENPIDALPFGLGMYDSQNFATAWDESSFGILSTSEHKKHMKELYEAFQRKDIAIGFGEGHAFRNAGLVLTIASRFSDESKKNIYDMDYEHYQMHQAAKNTGIYEVLEKAGKKYYALSPRWKDDEKTEIHFWLNPAEQQKYNYGWYTVEELQQWANNTGPIMMKKTSP